MSDRNTSSTDALLRGVRLATTSLDGEGSLAALLSQTRLATGASAAAVLTGDDFEPRFVCGCSREDLTGLMARGGPLRDALEALADRDEPLLVQGLGPGEGATVLCDRALLIALHGRGVLTGGLALFYGGEHEEGIEAKEQAVLLAGLIALVLENERLYEEAREAIQARDHFLAALNHELRTPATSFILMADMIRTMAADQLPPRVERLLGEAESQVTLLVDVLRRVLDLGSLGSSASDKRADIVRPREAVADLLRRLEPTARRRNLSLALYTPRDMPPLQTNADLFSRILLNLVSNAIKYSSDGRVEVRLEKATHRHGGGRAEPTLAVHVQDTGCGIPAAQLERIFDPFTQVEEGARTDSRRRGLGLGLPTARQLARSLGGDVRLASAPGQGTVATLVLPYLQSASGS